MESKILKTYCFVDQQTSSSPAIISTENNRVKYYDQKTTPAEFTFDKVFDSFHDFSRTSYNTVIAPLVQKVIAGESAMVVIGGPQSLNFSNYLISQTEMHGLINQSTQQLLNALNQDGTKQGSVTFSWYKMDCSSSESITDLLRSASTNENQTSSQFVIRDLGKGRGMYVPGAWAVEVANGNDIETVISRISQMMPNCDHSKGDNHMVMQLTVTNNRNSKSESAKENKTASTQGPNKAIDGPEVGRLTFFLMSDISPPQKNGLYTGDLNSRTYPWFGQLKLIINWLESKRPSPPFHKSRLVLSLRDVLCGRQEAAFMLLLKPKVPDNIAACYQWLDLAGTLSHGSKVVASSVSSAVGKLNATSRIATNSVTNTETASSQLNMSIVTTLKDEQTKQSTNTSAVTFSQLVADPNSRPRSATPTNRPDKISLKDALSLGSKAMSASSRPATTGSGLSISVSSPVSSGLDGYAQREVEMALTMALEEARKDVERYKRDATSAEDKVADLQNAYNSLIEQIKEEGSFLAKRDQERFRKALKDVSDYAIYKEVMEAAMVKMQNQIDMLLQENYELHNNLNVTEGDVRKAKSSSDKYTKDLSSTKKKLTEMESKFIQKEKECKQAQKERESAIATLSGARSDMGRREGMLRGQLECKDKELAELKKRAAALEDKLTEVTKDKKEIEVSYTQEIHSLRAKQTMTLDMLRKYQGENDILRATISELQGSINIDSST